MLRAAPMRAPRGAVASQRRASTPQHVVAAASAPRSADPSRRATLIALTAVAAMPLLASPPALAAAAAPAAPLAESLAPFRARCGAALLLPPGWVTASDRENAGRGALTLNLVGDFASVDTVSLRREPLPEGGAAWLDGSLPAADVAARLTAPEADAVAAGEAKGAVAGVVSGSTGTISFELLSASQRPAPFGDTRDAPYYTLETRVEQCRGNVQEGKGGALLCYGPRGDELPTITRHALSVYAPRPPFLYVLRASCVEERWAQLAPLLRDVAASFDASGVVNP